jgi:hypothetical protein
MKLQRLRIAFILVLVFLSLKGFSGPFKFLSPKPGLQDTARYVSPYAEDNERCLKCHGQERYEYRNETQDKQVRAIMCFERIVNRDLFYQSNHKTFSCTDCHSAEYESFPHPGELRMEPKLNCIDCHGGDETYAKYHFEVIDSEYVQSTHFKLQEYGFSCWKCHDPHTYKTSIRNTTDLKETIRYSNSICLNCHSNFSNYAVLTDLEEISIMEKHDWLPNQTAHFRSVRCIECHTKVSDSILVSHMIRSKTEAVSKCNECHSQNSLLMSSLYKYRSKEARQSNGFLNAVILNESFVIGANRNEYLNILSLVIFAGLLLVLAVHIFFRVRSSKIVKKGGEDVPVS